MGDKSAFGMPVRILLSSSANRPVRETANLAMGVDLSQLHAWVLLQWVGDALR